jgi:DNA-binding NarL/FixJ family response regulator
VATVAKVSQGRHLSVCLVSPHPLVLAEFQHFISQPRFRLQSRRIESTSAPDLSHLPLPRAQVYVVDVLPSRLATEALLAGILERYPTARLLVLAEKLTEAVSFPLLRLGAKGLLTYKEAPQQLERALIAVANGGFWVPRSLLSHFVDEILGSARGPRLVSSPAELSRREREVLDALLTNLSNKEIASKLFISERTVKFHVSNLLSKFGVRRRADLILLCYQNPASRA